MLLGYFVEYNPVRVFRFALTTGTIISGLGACDFINRHSANHSSLKSSNKRVQSTIIIGGAIMMMAVLSLASVYYSPMTYTWNLQVTRREIAGMKWFIKFKNPSIIVADTYTSTGDGWIPPFENYICGTDQNSSRRSIIEHVPSHFGYDQNNTCISQVFNFEDRYLIIFEVDKLSYMRFPENVRSKVPQYTDHDFAVLNSDPIVIFIYSNDEFEIRRVYGKGS